MSKNFAKRKAFLMQNVSVILKLIKTPQTGKTGIPHVGPDPRSGQIHLNEGTD